MLTMFFLAQTFAPAACAPAGSSIRVEAHSADFKPADVTYVVENRRRERISWVRVSPTAPLTIVTSAQYLKMPLDWGGAFEPATGGAATAVEWRALNDDATIGPHGSASFRLRGAQKFVLRPGESAVDFTAVPFTAGDDAGHCWSGITDSAEYSQIGVNASFTGGAARVISYHGMTRVLVDFPAGERQGRLSDHMFLIVPLALTWGVKGGFSVDGSIGIGLSYVPTKYVGLSAKDNIGTALFNNVTHLRTVGVDFNIPIARATFAQGLTRQNRFLVVGVEYFQRSASKLAGFLDGPQWYVSGRGVALRIGIRKLNWDWGP